MKLKVQFKRRNLDYNQDYSDFHNDGKESLDNPKYSWAMGFGVDQVQTYSELENDEVEIEAETKTGEKHHLTFNNMTSLYFTLVDGREGHFSVSKDLLSKRNLSKIEKYDMLRVYYYFKQDIPFIEIVSGVFVPEIELKSRMEKLNVLET